MTVILKEENTVCRLESVDVSADLPLDSLMTRVFLRKQVMRRAKDSLFRERNESHCVLGIKREKQKNRMKKEKKIFGIDQGFVSTLFSLISNDFTILADKNFATNVFQSPQRFSRGVEIPFWPQRER